MTARSVPILICLVAATAGFCYRWVVPAPGEPAPQVLRGKTSIPLHDSYAEADFRREFPGEVKAAREQAGLCALRADARLEKWLNDSDRGISCANLKPVMARASMPGFKTLHASGVTGGSLREFSGTLLGMLTAPATASDNRMGILIQNGDVIVLTGEALPELTLAGLNDGSSDSFVNQCPHCLKQSSLICEKSTCGLVVDCPDCGLRCRVLAPDTNGRYHEATSFLTRSSCPEIAPGADPLDVMLGLWQTAVRRCRYVEDPKSGDAATDVWQTPAQTLRRGAGDCEDSALLLTDWLLTRGISARMVTGKMDGGGHAWCIARVGGTDYLLESTNRNPDMTNLPVVNPNDGYEPATLMDRDALYVPAKPGEPFDGDYWSPKKWIKLPRAKSAAVPKSTAALEK